MRQLVFRVGRNSPNFGSDVQTVADMLSKIPGHDGGAQGEKPLIPSGPLPFETKATPELVAAIEKFQKAQFGSELATGYVDTDSATFYRMLKLSSGQPLKPMTGGQRDRICQKALEYVGKVSDQGIQCRRPRKGGDLLRRIFSETIIGANAWWSDPAEKEFDYNGNTYKITKLQGVMEACMRVPQGKNAATGSNQGMSWCGVYATWIWKQCGLEMAWESGVGPKAEQVRVKPSQNFRALAPGDIVVNKGGEVHHYIVLSMTASKAPSMESVDGNSMYQAIAHQNKWSASNASYFYSLDTVRTFQPYPFCPGPSTW